LVPESSLTNQLSNRVSNYFRVGSVHCQPYLGSLQVQSPILVRHVSG